MRFFSYPIRLKISFQAFRVLKIMINMNALKCIVQAELLSLKLKHKCPVRDESLQLQRNWVMQIELDRLPECVFILRRGRGLDSFSPRFDVSHEFVTYVLTD